MNPGPLGTFTQEKSIQEYLQIEKLCTLHTHWAPFREQPPKNGHVLGFGDYLLLLAVSFYENIHYIEFLKDKEGQACCLL